MGTKRVMSIVVDFDSESPQAEGEAELKKSFDYVRIFDALVHSQEIATTVFARCAKKHFRKIVDDVRLKTSSDSDVPFPLWFTSASVALEVGDNREVVKAQAAGMASLIEELVEELAGMVKRLRKDRKNMVLINALVCHLTEVGPFTFKFEVKQRWGFER